MTTQPLSQLFSYLVLPDYRLFLCVAFSILLDFITGIMKAKVAKEARTSGGFRKSIQKIAQYASCTIGSFVLINLAAITRGHIDIQAAALIGNGLMVAIIYIEVTSIFENAYAINSDSLLSRYFIKPALNILTFQLKNNPATKNLSNEKSSDSNITE